MLLTLRGVKKNFGGIRALRDANLEVRAGEVHLLMGENGAGKSTLMRMVAGMHQRDGGEMLWRGQPVSFRNPSEASSQGIAMVHQESLLAPHLTVAENIYLGREPLTKTGLVRRRVMIERAASLIAGNGFHLDAEATVQTLSPAGRQLVEICRAIAQSSSLLIFDEPTSSLSDKETGEVFRIVGRLRDQQVGVIYITHRLEELRSLGDRVTVLRDGATVFTGALQDLSREQLIQHMVGRKVDSVYSREPLKAGEPLLRVQNLSRGWVRDISFEIRAGEIVGLAGLMGAGRTELCRMLFGVDRPESGTFEIGSKAVTFHSPQDAAAAGVALIPEDRQRDGLALRLPITHNITLPDLNRYTQFGFLQKSREAMLAEDYRQRLRIKCDTPKQLAGRMSGGNQQKVVIAKWMARGARVFLFDEPTRGIDIGAKQDVFEQMDQLARGGAAVLMVSSELPELVQVADRILVMREGRLSGELPRGASQEEIMRMAAPSGATSAAGLA
ncbi:MAG TPA: sugar ABC transporter ATP-binding protein [Bryobacteraceae bacterium]|nr:sugar ABC transporter ATP-binding protein [Bryobacteraceae bacterium]